MFRLFPHAACANDSITENFFICAHITHYTVSIKKSVRWERMWPIERRKLNSFGKENSKSTWYPFLISLNNLPCLPSPSPYTLSCKSISQSGELTALGRRSGRVTFTGSEATRQKFQENGILSHLGVQTPLVLAIILSCVERKELYKF